MRSTIRHTLAIGLALLSAAGSASAEELRGSIKSMRRQHGVARAEDYTFLRSPAQVREFAEKGRLLPIEEGDDVALADVSHPVARAEVRELVERLAGEYRRATGSRLVVTSLTRPKSMQPANAHDLSVHPAGMAADFRIPGSAKQRAWLESRLLELERAGVLDVTRERNPPHYHVAVFPDAYRAFADTVTPLPPLPPPREARAAGTETNAAGLPARDSAARVVASAGPDVTGRPGSGGLAGVLGTVGALLMTGVVLRRRARGLPGR